MTKERIDAFDRYYTRKLDILRRIKDIDYLLDLMGKYQQCYLSVKVNGDDFGLLISDFEDATCNKEKCFDILLEAVRNMKKEYEKLFSEVCADNILEK